MATQLFLRNTASDLAGAGQKALATTRGAASVNLVTNITAADVQVTATAGGQILEWLSPAYNAITVSGAVTVNIRGLESATAANAAAGIIIDRVNNDATAVLSTIVPLTSIPAASNEYTTADTAKNAAVTPTATSLVAGNRIRVRLFVRAAAGTVIGTGRTVTNTVEGAAAGAAGDTYVTFTENFVAFTGGIRAPAVLAASTTIGGQSVVGAVRQPGVIAATTSMPTPLRPQALFVKIVGTALKSGSALTTTLTLTQSVAAGHRLVVVWFGSVTNVDVNVFCQDSRDNTYVPFGSTKNLNADLAISGFSAPVVTALQVGDTITITQGGQTSTTGWIWVSEWQDLTIPGFQSGTTGTGAGPAASGAVTTDAASVHFGLLATYKSGVAAPTGTGPAGWTPRNTQVQTTSSGRWYGVWDRQSVTGEPSTDFAPTLSAAADVWASAQLVLTSGTEPPQPSIMYAWPGNISSGGVTVAVRSVLAATLRLVYSVDQALTSPAYSAAGSPDGNGYTKLSVAGLAPGTRYYYGIELDGVVQGFVGQFTTSTTAGTPQSFTVVGASCWLTEASGVGARMLARDATLNIIMGDFPYADISTNDQSLIRQAREGLVGRPEVYRWLRSRPGPYTWSDHDFGSNNAVGTSASKPAAQAVYRQQVPHHPLEVSDAIYHSFVYGRVRFILTDNRSFKSLQTDTDNSTKTVLGTTQKTWFKNLITSATEPLIVWVNEHPWIGTAGTGDDEWSNYNTERTELANHISASGKRVIIWAGDMHAVAYDSGTNSAGRIPVMHASPMRNAFSNKGGPYTLGPYPTSAAANVEQYGLWQITDDGTVMSVRFQGVDMTDVTRVDATLTWITPPPIGVSTSVGAAGLPTGGLRSPGVVAVVTTMPDADAVGEAVSSQPSTLIARTSMGQDLEPPTVPTGLHATGLAQTVIDLAWNPSTDNVAVGGYEVLIEGPM